MPPEGWRCTRDSGHEGPCAATPREPDPDIRDHEFIDVSPSYCGLCGLPWRRHKYKHERRERVNKKEQTT